MGKRELVALLNLSSWCLVMVEWLFLSVQWGCLRFVIVIFPDHTHFLFLDVGKMGFIFCGKIPLLVIRTQVSDPGLMDPLVSVCVGRREDQNNTKSGPSSAHQRTAFRLQVDDCTT